MAMIAVVGQDMGVLHRWTKAIREGGHESTILIPGELHDSGSPVCLFDLGAGSDPTTQPLIQAVSAEPQIRFVAMTSYPNAAEGLSLLQAGVKGYCNRLVNPAVLNALIHTVDGDEIWAGSQVTDYLLKVSLRSEAATEGFHDDVLAQLTPRERVVAGQVASGHSNKVIAAENGISERTVKAHLNAIFRKTGVRNRVQLALAITRSGDAKTREAASRA